MSVSLLSLVFGVAAAGNFTMIGAGLALARGRASPVGSLGAAFAFIVAAAAVTIGAGGVADIRIMPILEWIEFLLTLSAGPVFYRLISALWGRSASAIPASVPALAAGSAVALLFTASGDAPDIRLALLMQMGYSAAAVGVIVSPAAKPASLRLARALVGAMALVHLVQAARMAAPHIHALAPAVPIMMCLLALCIVFAAMAALATRAGAGKERGALPTTAAELRELMTADGAFLNPDYRLADLAAAARLSPAEISRTVNEQTGSGFVSILNRERLRHASTLLLSPQEARTSIEAIALLSGFRSRSAFYRAFVDVYGLSPAAYRKAQTLS
jgi:AraC-like DNA-binding protein